MNESSKGKTYMEPKAEIVIFSVQAIIVTSGGYQEDESEYSGH